MSGPPLRYDGGEPLVRAVAATFGTARRSEPVTVRAVSLWRDGIHRSQPAVSDESAHVAGHGQWAPREEDTMSYEYYATHDYDDN
jgi:hypothetical protein